VENVAWCCAWDVPTSPGGAHRNLQMDTAPVRGRFEDGAEGRVGVFVADDVLEGVPVVCRFRWTVLNPRSARWEQAFSTDGGVTWETNWTMIEDRVDP